MDEILKSIDARDTAVLLWLGLMLVVVNRKSEVRKAFGGFWRAFTHYKILIAIVFAAAITALLCYCLYVVGIWSVNQLKGCVVWFLAACIPSMMDIPKLSEDFSLFKKAALKNFELSVFVSFYLNLFKGTVDRVGSRTGRCGTRLHACVSGETRRSQTHAWFCSKASCHPRFFLDCISNLQAFHQLR